MCYFSSFKTFLDPETVLTQAEVPLTSVCPGLSDFEGVLAFFSRSSFVSQERTTEKVNWSVVYRVSLYIR